MELDMVYGYCRISTRKQNIERQIRNILREFPDAVIVQEEYTGTKLDRKEWQKLMRCVSSGDTIIFDSVSRMSRCRGRRGIRGAVSSGSQPCVSQRATH